MYPTYANDIGGIGAVLQQQEAQRQQASQAALAVLMHGLAQMKQQQNLDRQRGDTLALQNRTFDTNARNQALENQYRNRMLDEYYKPSLLERNSVAHDREALAAANQKAAALKYVVEKRLPYDPKDFADVHPEIRDPLFAQDQALRAQETGDLQRARDIALSGQRINRITQREKELKDASSGTHMFDWILPRSSKGAGYYPREQAADMETRVSPYRQRYAPVLDPKAGYVEPDLSGGYIPNRGLILPWMNGGTNAPAGPAAPQRQALILDQGAAVKLLSQAKGDKDLARKLAVQAGYAIPQMTNAPIATPPMPMRSTNSAPADYGPPAPYGPSFQIQDPGMIGFDEMQSNAPIAMRNAPSFARRMTNAPAPRIQDPALIGYDEMQNNARRNAPMLATNAQAQPRVAPAQTNYGVVQLAQKVQDDFQQGRISQDDALRAMSSIEGAVVRAFKAGKMSENDAVKHLVSLGATRSEAIANLNDE